MEKDDKQAAVEENDSIWLFDILETIGVCDENRKCCKEYGILMEKLRRVDQTESFYCFGSMCEGTNPPSDLTDYDTMSCTDTVYVIEDIAESADKTCLYIVKESGTPAGYIKLQLVQNGKEWDDKLMSTYEQNNREKPDDCFKVDKDNRIWFVDFPIENNLKPKNKPAYKIDKSETYVKMDVDIVYSCCCKTWPSMADEWLTRERIYGWPTKSTIEELKSLGFFIVKKGHPSSPEIDLEWRISFSLQERKLMFDITDIQYKSFVVLKMVNREIIKLDFLTSYHWKTCLFYVIEQNDRNVWEKKRLFHCINMCIKQMLKWVKDGICPNYFIPKENLFDAMSGDSYRLILENILEKVLNLGFESLLYVKGANLGDYIRSRGSSEWYNRLLLESKKYTRNIKKYHYNYKQFITELRNQTLL